MTATPKRKRAASARPGAERELRRRAGAVAYVRSINPDRDQRPELDFYRTPACVTRGLLHVEDVPGPVWEPACGDGAIARVLTASGLSVVGTDLTRRGYGRGGVDFLFPGRRPGRRFNSIVTNPPFTHMGEFVQRALEHECKKVCMVGRLLWLEGQWLTPARLVRRKAFFETSGLARVWVFSSRVNIPPDRYKPKKPNDGRGGMVAFAWYVWVRGHRGAPRLGWIDVTELER